MTFVIKIYCEMLKFYNFGMVYETLIKTNFMRQFFVFFSLFIPFLISAQNQAVGNNEKLVFTASYNMSGILNDLAQVTMETNTVKTSSSTLLHLKCTATTYSKWDSFFKIRDLYESYVSPTSMTPYLYKRDINEGGYYKFMEYKYDQKKQTVSSLKTKRRKDGSFWDEKKNLTIDANTKDLVATLYKLRTFDFTKATKGKSKTMTVLFDNEEHKVSFTFLGTETISTAIGKKNCYKLAVAVNTSDVLKGTNDNLLWLTADDNKIPVYAQFKIAVGTGELRIKSASGLKN